MKYSGFYDFESDATYKKIYDQKYKQEKQKYEEWLNSAITSDLTGKCNGVSYECTRGQKNKDCVPEPCWAIHDETASELMFKHAIEEEFIQQKILEECGTQETPSKTSNTTVQTDNVISDWKSRPCTAAELAAINATAGETRLVDENDPYNTNDYCRPTSCKSGYKLNSDGTACVSGSESASQSNKVVSRASAPTQAEQKDTKEEVTQRKETPALAALDSKTVGVEVEETDFETAKNPDMSNIRYNNTVTINDGTITISVSGTITDEGGKPVSGAKVQAENDSSIQTTTDTNGNFKIDKLPEEEFLIISHDLYEEQNVQPAEQLSIVLYFRDCTNNEFSNITNATKAKKAYDTNGEIFCKVTECTEGYIPNKTGTDCTKDYNKYLDIMGTECTPETSISHATKTVFQYDNDKQELICCVSQCAPGFKANSKTCTCDEVICKEYEKLDKNQKNCISRDGDDCTPTDPNAKSGTYTVTTVEGQTSGMCKITDCENGFVPNEDGTACERGDGDCTAEQLKEIPNATKGQKKKGVCYATECGAGYEVEKGKCVAISGDCKPMPDNAKSAHREYSDDAGKEICIVDSCKDGYTVSNDKLSCIAPTLSEEDSKKKIAELQENYDAMKEKEQSTANKLLGAGAMASIGAGGQMIASSLAEQQADEAAELDMTAYLATFRCDFGQGRNIKGGETDIVLPGGNALAPLYTEYVQLAQDLKVRKEALGMTPGIESEEILDKANMGLYDNESIGKTDGAFTSLASALSNPTGADAAEWAAQKAETAEQLKTGAITAGVGAVASIAANIAINENKNAKQENSAEIIKRYEALKKLQQDVEKLPDQEANAKCPTGSTGTYPICTCTSNTQVFNTDTNTCTPCPTGKIAKNGVCLCPDDKIPNSKGGCDARQNSTSKITCKIENPYVYINPITNECGCLHGYVLSADKTDCSCPQETHKLSDIMCEKKTTSTPPSSEAQPNQAPQTITLATKNLFKLNSSDLTNEATTTINTFVNNVKATLTNETAYCINVTGHTDRTGTDEINNPLSQKRANAVKNALENAGLNGNNIKAYGAGSTTCKANGNQPECRKVEIEFTSSACSA